MEKVVVVAGPVIVENNNVLLDISGEDNFWKFCGGKSHNKETPRETASRRAKEELGINITISENIDPFVIPIKKTVHDEEIGIEEEMNMQLFHFLAQRSGDIHPGEGVIEWKWIPISELDEYELAPNIIPTLKHFGFIA